MTDDLKARPIPELTQMLKDVMAEIERRARENSAAANPSTNSGKDDTAQRPGAGDTTAPSLREREGHDCAAKLAKEVAREYVANRQGTVNAFYRIVRRLGVVVPHVKAIEIAQVTFPKEYLAWKQAMQDGQELPPLFPKPDRKKRLAEAVAAGGRLV